MLTLRLLPRGGGVVRSGVAAVESTAVLVVGHIWAGGMLPSYSWVALMAAAVFAAGIPVLSGRLRLRYAVPGLVALQLLLHAWLTVLAPLPAAGGHGAHGAHLGGLLSPSMLAVHVLGALVTALVWEIRARVVDVVVTWAPQQLPPVPAARRLPACAVASPRPTTALVAMSAPRRGPPSARPVPAPA